MQCHVEQAAAGGLPDKPLEDIVNNVSEVGKKAIDRVSRPRPIEPTTQPDGRIPKLSCNGPNAVDILVVTVKKAANQLGWFVVSCLKTLRLIL